MVSSMSFFACFIKILYVKNHRIKIFHIYIRRFFYGKEYENEVYISAFLDNVNHGLKKIFYQMIWCLKVLLESEIL